MESRTIFQNSSVTAFTMFLVDSWASRSIPFLGGRGYKNHVHVISYIRPSDCFAKCITKVPCKDILLEELWLGKIFSLIMLDAGNGVCTGTWQHSTPHLINYMYSTHNIISLITCNLQYNFTCTPQNYLIYCTRHWSWLATCWWQSYMYDLSLRPRHSIRELSLGTAAHPG